MELKLRDALRVSACYLQIAAEFCIYALLAMFNRALAAEAYNGRAREYMLWFVDHKMYMLEHSKSQ